MLDELAGASLAALAGAARTAQAGQSTAASADVRQVLWGMLAAMFQIDAGSLDGTERLSTLGIDSLMALKLKAQLESAIGIEIPVSKLIGDLSLDEVVQALSERVAQQPAPEQAVPTPADVQGLSDNELEALAEGLSEAEIEQVIRSMG